VAGFGVYDMNSEIEHLVGQLLLGDVLKARGLISNFVGIAQHQAQQALALWFEQ
jgi:hypothetical protein